MTRSLRGCVVCVRTRRSHADNLRRLLPWFCIFLFAAGAEAQVQVDLKFKRLQYIAYEPVVATVAITNLAGRDIEIHDAEGQSWLGFEITGSEEQPIAPLSGANREAPLKIQAGQRVTRQIDLTPLYPVNEFGAYHVRTNIYFADLGKFFYSGTGLRSHGRAADLAANRGSSGRRGRRCAHVFAYDQSFSRPHSWLSPRGNRTRTRASFMPLTR